MIKNIYRAKKNTYILETEKESNVINFTVLNLKDYTAEKHTYPKSLRKDYEESKKLRKVTYGEFEKALKCSVSKLRKRIDYLSNKFLSLTDTKGNPEYRHFVYEFESGVLPMLTEGVVKVLAVADRINLLYKSNQLHEALKEVEDELYNETFIEDKNLIRQNPIMQVLVEQNYCECVVKAKNYVFKPEFFDDEDIEEDNEEIAENTYCSSSCTVNDDTSKTSASINLSVPLEDKTNENLKDKE